MQPVVIAVIVVFWLLLSVKVLNEYERAVIFRLGKLLPDAKGPGLTLVAWPIDRMVRVSLRTVVLDVPPQDVITRDNVSVKVNAVVYFRVVHPMKAVVQVENYLYATSQMAQTTLRSVLGQAHLDELLSEREKRAKIIHASGEFEASKQLTQAAQALQEQPMALHLRYLQTLTEIAAEKNSTIIFPIPIDWMKALIERAK